MGWADRLMLSQRLFRFLESLQERTEEQVISFPYGYQDQQDRLVLSRTCRLRPSP